MTFPIQLFFLLFIFSLVLGIVSACYRYDSPSEIIQGLPRRVINFFCAVSIFAAIAYFLSGYVLSPA